MKAVLFIFAAILVLAVAQPCTNNLTGGCTWYGSTGCCTNEQAAGFEGSYNGIVTACKGQSAQNCQPSCTDLTHMVLCRSCASNAAKTVCKAFCTKYRDACGASSLILLGAIADCNSLTDSDCWNSAASVAVSAVFVALVALIALLF